MREDYMQGKKHLLKKDFLLDIKKIREIWWEEGLHRSWDTLQLSERLQRDVGCKGGHSRQGNQSGQRYRGLSRKQCIGDKNVGCGLKIWDFTRK